MMLDQRLMGRAADDLFELLALLKKGRFLDAHEGERLVTATIQKAQELLVELRQHLRESLGGDPTIPQQRYAMAHSVGIGCGRAFTTGHGSRQ